MDSPFAFHRRRRNAPNSRIFTPFTGKRRCPRVAAKATAGNQAARVLERGEVGPGGVVLDRTRLGARRAGGGIEARFELGDEVLEAVDLARQVGGALAVRRQAPARSPLASLPLVDQNVHTQLLAPEQIEIARQTLMFADDSPCARAPDRRDRRRARRPVHAYPARMAPSMIAVRTACSASSGCTRSAGGG